MNQQAAAIVIAGALIAVAIMLTNRWTLISTPNSVRTDALLLNRGQALLMSASQRHRWGRCIVVRHDGGRAPKARAGTADDLAARLALPAEDGGDAPAPR